MTKFYTITLMAFDNANTHTEILPYTKDSDQHPLASTSDIPSTLKEMDVYAKDCCVIPKTKKIIFHARFRSSIPPSTMKQHRNPVTTKSKKMFMALIRKYDFWVGTQGCAATRVSCQGWFINSHPADAIE